MLTLDYLLPVCERNFQLVEKSHALSTWFTSSSPDSVLAVLVRVSVVHPTNVNNGSQLSSSAMFRHGVKLLELSSALPLMSDVLANSRGWGAGIY